MLKRPQKGLFNQVCPLLLVGVQMSLILFKFQYLFSFNSPLVPSLMFFCAAFQSHPMRVQLCIQLRTPRDLFANSQSSSSVYFALLQQSACKIQQPKMYLNDSTRWLCLFRPTKVLCSTWIVLPLHHNPTKASRRRAGVIVLTLFPFSQASHFCTAYCSISENSWFMYFVLISSCLQYQYQFGASYSSMIASRSLQTSLRTIYLLKIMGARKGVWNILSSSPKTRNKIVIQ